MYPHCAHCGKEIKDRPVELEGETYCSLQCMDNSRVYEEEDFLER